MYAATSTWSKDQRGWQITLLGHVTFSCVKSILRWLIYTRYHFFSQKATVYPFFNKKLTLFPDFSTLLTDELPQTTLKRKYAVFSLERAFVMQVSYVFA